MNDKILNKVSLIIKSNYSIDDSVRIGEVKDDVIKLFSGKLKGYQKCDIHYHDFKHTIQVINPLAEIISGWNSSGTKPEITFKFFELAIIAALLHDAGYIKETGDNEGTGGKYAFEHIGRSVAFANKYLSSKAFNENEIKSVCNMILCTGFTEKTIKFSSDEERICGNALGTADLISQLSSKDYPEKLPELYNEFEEAYIYTGIEKLREKGALIFKSAEDLIKSTFIFYNSVVKNKIRNMGSLDSYMQYNNRSKKNYYKAAIEKNILKLQSSETIKPIC